MLLFYDNKLPNTLIVFSVLPRFEYKKTQSGYFRIVNNYTIESK